MRHLLQKNYPIQAKENRSTDWNFSYKFSKLYYNFGDSVIDPNTGTIATYFAKGKKYFFKPDLTLERRVITSIRLFTTQSFIVPQNTVLDLGLQVVPVDNSLANGFFLNLLDNKNNYILKDIPVLTFLYDPSFIPAYFKRNTKLNVENISLERSYVTTNVYYNPASPFAGNVALIFNFYTKYLQDGSLYHD